MPTRTDPAPSLTLAPPSAVDGAPITAVPRWFYRLLGACAVLVTLAVCAVAAAAVLRLRFARANDYVTLDTWQRALCTTDDCVRVSRTVIARDSSMHREHDYPPGRTPPPLP